MEDRMTDQLKAVEAALKPRPSATILGERAKTHGAFDLNAQISQDFKQYMYSKGNPPPLAVHREALDMIFMKISRILSGNPDYRDHWDDIAGYAKLASLACPTSQSSS
jgi:hypothetical protein